jgi:uncharacterized protein YjbI with pentapeptide repeats
MKRSTTARGVRSTRNTRRNPELAPELRQGLLDFLGSPEGDEFRKTHPRAWQLSARPVLKSPELLAMEVASVGPRAYMEGAYLEGADLRGRDLSGATLNGANLMHANLSGANLQEAWLDKANLVKADLLFADLRRAKLRNADLTGASLRGVDASRANFTHAKLRGANLGSFTVPNTDVAATTNLNHAVLETADLREANLEGASLRGASAHLAILEDANLKNADLRDANFYGSSFIGADLRGADLRGAHIIAGHFANANLAGATLEGVNLTEADFTNANLEGANLEGAEVEGANFTGANLKNTVLGDPPTREARSYGRQTGAVLKMGKGDAPSRATEFKKRYPAEFERLKADTQGRDFSEPLRTQVRKKYETPFAWLVSEGLYTSETQRLCPEPNLVYKFNINVNAPSFTERQRAFLKRLAETSRRSGHPYERGSFFTVGWVRLCVNNDEKTWLVEEVQSDVGVVREKLKDGSAPPGLEEYADVIADMRPYIDRFYEDALGIVFVEAEKNGYAVEMLTYETKKPMGSPRSVYTDLPRAMGMQRQKGSKVISEEAETWYYKPNPRASSRASGGRSTRSARKRR